MVYSVKAFLKLVSHIQASKCRGIGPGPGPGPQPAYKTFKDILMILLGSIVAKKWVFLYMYFAIS